MANSSKSVEHIVEGGGVGEEERKRFKPFRAIRRMLKGKKKAKELSQSMGSVLYSSDDVPSASKLARSVSHESVFAKDDVAMVLTEKMNLRSVLSVGDVTDVPIDRLKVTEQSTSPTNDGINDSPTKTGNSKDRRLPGTEKPVPKARPGKAQKEDPDKVSKIKLDKVKTNDVPDTNTNMNELTTDVPRLNNKLAYDKISVRPKRRPARNARGAQQKHTIRVIETPVNGFSEDDTVNENHIEDDSRKKDAHTSPATSSKPALPGFLLPPVNESPPGQDAEESVASEPPKRALRKSPMGGVPGGFAPSLHDVQAFRNRSKKSEEPTSPAPKEAVPAKRPAEVPDSKPASDEKPKKSPKVAKKAHKKSGESSSSSVFSWKHKSKSPTSPRKSKTTDHAKDGDKPKGLFSGLKSKKTDKESKSVSLTSKLFSSGDKKEQSKKKQAEIAKSSEASAKKAREGDKVAEKPVSAPVEKMRVTVDTVSTTPDSGNARVLLESKQTSPAPGKVRLPFPEKPTSPDPEKVSKPFQTDPRSPPVALETPTSPPTEHDRLTPSPVPDLLGGSLLDQINFEMSKKRELSSDSRPDSASGEENLAEGCESAIAKADQPESELEIGSRSDLTCRLDIASEENRESDGEREAVPNIDDDAAVPSESEEAIVVETDSESRSRQSSPKPVSETHSETDADKELESQSETLLHVVMDKSPPSAELSRAEVAEDVDSVEVGNAYESTDVACQKASNASDVVVEKPSDAAVAVGTVSALTKDTDLGVQLTDNAAVSSTESPVDESSKEGSSDGKIEAAADDIHEASSKTPERDQADVEESQSAVKVTGEPKEYSADSQILNPTSEERVESVRTELHAPAGEVPKPDADSTETSETNVSSQEDSEVATKSIVASPVSSSNIKEKAAETKREEQTIPQKSRRSPAKAARRGKILEGDKNLPPGDHPGMTLDDKSKDTKPTSSDSSGRESTEPIAKLDKSKPQTVDTDANPAAKSRVTGGQGSIRKEEDVHSTSDRPKVKDSAPPKVDDIPKPDRKSQPERGTRTPSVKASSAEGSPDLDVSTTAGKTRGASGRESAPSFFRTQLKPVSRGSANGKSRSIRISPGDPAAKPLRPRSWDVKDGAGPSKSTDQPGKKAKPSPNQFSPTTEKPKLAEKPKSPVKSPTKSPGAKPAVNDAQNKTAKSPKEGGSFSFPDPKPAPRQTSHRQKKEAPGDGDKPQPDWVKIARRHSRHWEDGSSFKPRSSSTSSPTEAGVKDRPAAMATSPKRRTLSSSKPDVPSPKSSNVSSPLSAPSNRTPPVPAVGTSPSSKISPPANDQPKPAGGKPAWLAIAMQKQKKWGTKEEMV